MPPPLTAGITIGRNQVCAVVVGNASGAPEVCAVHTHEMTAPLFADRPTADNENGLAAALHAVSDEFRSAYASVHVALPDTAIRSAVFELDDLPKTEALRLSLLRWRFSGEWLRPEDSLVCRGFDLGEDRGRRLFFGQAADRSWLECVQRALGQAGIAPWSLNAAAVYRFNCFHDAIAGEGSALLSVEPGYWNLLIWDEKGRIRRVLTRLREGMATGEAGEVSVANEVERAILAYVHADGGRKVARLHLSGSEGEVNALANIFDERLSERVVPLNNTHGVISGNVAGLSDGLAPLALAAALSS